MHSSLGVLLFLYTEMRISEDLGHPSSSQNVTFESAVTPAREGWSLFHKIIYSLHYLLQYLAIIAFN